MAVADFAARAAGGRPRVDGRLGRCPASPGSDSGSGQASGLTGFGGPVKVGARARQRRASVAIGGVVGSRPLQRCAVHLLPHGGFWDIPATEGALDVVARASTRRLLVIPTFDALAHPLLQVLASHATGLPAADAHDAVADAVGLSSEDRSLVIASGQLLYRNRVGWAQDLLKRNGLTESPARGRWAITLKGRDLLTANPSVLSKETLSKLMEARTPSSAVGPATEQTQLPIAVKLSPDERIDLALREIEEANAGDLLERVKTAMSDSGFERFVLRLLQKMGYGNEVRHTGMSGDGGIDGVINQDHLGLARVFVQAKKWSETPVGRPEIQKFHSAVIDADKNGRGVIFTTSRFTSDAEEFAKRNGISVVDGRRLVALMLKFRCGVESRRTIELVRIDEDFFEDFA